MLETTRLGSYGPIGCCADGSSILGVEVLIGSNLVIRDMVKSLQLPVLVLVLTSLRSCARASYSVE